MWEEKGIYTTRDYSDLYELKDLDMIIELTGHDEVAKEIAQAKPDRVRLVDHVAARLFWDIFQIEEQRLAESRQASEALRESEERFQQVAENAEEWIWEIDANGLYTYTNSIVEKILGYKPAELIGKKHFYDIFYPDDKEELKQAAFEVFAKKGFFREFINRNVHKNGGTVWLSTSGVPVVNRKGKLIGYRGADTDITERRRADEALVEAKEDWENTFD
ncbi:MAG: PAS domain S-box protein, partial [Deltaproteobacteria bacterium]|nr:PAS domain S-box protein [Deltaproteobacteria bacterium]